MHAQRHSFATTTPQGGYLPPKLEAYKRIFVQHPKSFLAKVPSSAAAAAPALVLLAAT
jgi:hypothetical protein